MYDRGERYNDGTAAISFRELFQVIFLKFSHKFIWEVHVLLTNKWALNWIMDWKVEIDKHMMSDHRLIGFNIGNEHRRETLLARRYRKANWDVYRQLLGKMELEFLEEPDTTVDTLSEAIMDNLLEALDEVAPKKMSAVGDTDSWWTAELKELRSQIKKRYKKKHKDQQVMDKIASLKKDYNRKIKEAKTTSWKDFVSKAQTAKEVSKIIQILENPPMRRMSLLKDNDGNTLSPAGSVDHLLSTHFPDGVLRAETNISPNDSDVDFSGICQYITPRKVKAALESFGDYKSPGPDELPPVALKNMDEKHLEAVCLLYQLSITTGGV